MQDASTPSTADESVTASGETAKDLGATSKVSTAEHAHGSAPRTLDDEMVATDFGGLDSDLVDMSGIDSQPTDVDETSAGGLKFPDDKAVL